MAYDPASPDPLLVAELEELSSEYADLGHFLLRLEQIDNMIRERKLGPARHKIAVLQQQMLVRRGKLQAWMLRDRVPED